MDFGAQSKARMVPPRIDLYQNISGIFNVGTGKASSFNSLAKEVIKYFHKGKVKYIDFPENLVNSYQPFTKANVNKLRKAGYKKKFITIESGIKKYLDFLSIDKNTWLN